MKRASFWLIILFLAVPLGFAFAQLKSPPLGERESGGAVATEDGKPRWTNHWTMDRVTVDGKPTVHFIETGQGKYSPFTEEVKWKTESWWLDNGEFRPLRFEKTFSDPSGKALMREREEFDWTEKQARFERQDLRNGGKNKTETIDVPDDTISVEGIAAALRAVPFSEGKRMSAHLLSNEPKLYDVKLVVRGKETCKTSRGSTSCYKLELVPDLGALNLFKFAFPKTYFWYSADAPHEWLRYEGLEAGRGTPEIVMEPEGSRVTKR